METELAFFFCALTTFSWKALRASSKTVQSIEKDSSKMESQLEAIEQSGGGDNKLLQLLSLIF